MHDTCDLSSSSVVSCCTDTPACFLCIDPACSIVSPAALPDAGWWGMQGRRLLQTEAEMVTTYNSLVTTSDAIISRSASTYTVGSNPLVVGGSASNTYTWMVRDSMSGLASRNFALSNDNTGRAVGISFNDALAQACAADPKVIPDTYCTVSPLQLSGLYFWPGTASVVFGTIRAPTYSGMLGTGTIVSGALRMVLNTPAAQITPDAVSPAATITVTLPINLAGQPTGRSYFCIRCVCSG